ncbi:MAG: hypothetical protein AAFV62_11450, partial [Pseudomonadota bacterium]
IKRLAQITTCSACGQRICKLHANARCRAEPALHQSPLALLSTVIVGDNWAIATRRTVFILEKSLRRDA